MSGGNHARLAQPCARRLATGLLGGLLVAPWASAASAPSRGRRRSARSDAAPAVASRRIAAHGPDEKSIVVGTAAASRRTWPTSPSRPIERPTTTSSRSPTSRKTSPSWPTAPTIRRRRSRRSPTNRRRPSSSRRRRPRVAGRPADNADGRTTFASTTSRLKPTPPRRAPSRGRRSQAASFNGVTPGVTTRAEVLSRVGQARSRQTDAATRSPTSWKTFRRSRSASPATWSTSIRVELAQPGQRRTADRQARPQRTSPRRASQDDGRHVLDDVSRAGRHVHHSPTSAHGERRRPRRTTPTPRCREIVIRPIEAAPFVVRAEASPPRDYARSHRRPGNGAAARSARTPRRRLLLASSSWPPARLSPPSSWLPRPSTWSRERRVPAAVGQVPEVPGPLRRGRRADAPGARRDDRDASRSRPGPGANGPAGRAGLEGSARAGRAAAQQGDRAGRPAGDAATIRPSAPPPTSCWSSAHLAVAERIAVGDWQDKDEVVGQWICRASALAEQMIEAGEADVSLRLQVARERAVARAGGSTRRSIRSCGSTKPSRPPPISRRSIDDALARDELNWQLGLAYFYATEIRTAAARPRWRFEVRRPGRRDARAAGRSPRRAAGHRVRVGPAVLPDWRRPCGAPAGSRRGVPVVRPRRRAAVEAGAGDAAGGPGQHGDALVSMGVSYWEIGDRERAYELTEAGRASWSSRASPRGCWRPTRSTCRRATSRR